MDQTNNVTMHADDTIDLRKLFSTLQKRKKLIFSITALFMLLALVYIFVTKPVYQVQAMIEVGKVNVGTKDETVLDNIADIKQKLEYIYGVKSKQAMRLPKVKSISVNKQAKSVFSVLVEGHSNEEAVTFIEGIVKKVEKEYEEQVHTFMHTQKELILLTQEDIKTAQENFIKIQKTLENYSQKIMNLSTEDAALAGIYTIQISQNQTQAQSLQALVSALKAKEYNLKLSISPLRIKQTHIVGNVEVLEKPIKPKKILIFLVSLITGLIFSVFMVFLLEFLRSIKEEM